MTATTNNSFPDTLKIIRQREVVLGAKLVKLIAYKAKKEQINDCVLDLMKVQDIQNVLAKSKADFARVYNEQDSETRELLINGWLCKFLSQPEIKDTIFTLLTDKCAELDRKGGSIVDCVPILQYNRDVLISYCVNNALGINKVIHYHQGKFYFVSDSKRQNF